MENNIIEEHWLQEKKKVLQSSYDLDILLQQKFTEVGSQDLQNFQSLSWVKDGALLLTQKGMAVSKDGPGKEG